MGVARCGRARTISKKGMVPWVSYRMFCLYLHGGQNVCIVETCCTPIFLHMYTVQYTYEHLLMHLVCISSQVGWFHLTWPQRPLLTSLLSGGALQLATSDFTHSLYRLNSLSAASSAHKDQHNTFIKVLQQYRSGIFHKSKRPPARGQQTLCSTQLPDLGEIFKIVSFCNLIWHFKVFCLNF